MAVREAARFVILLLVLAIITTWDPGTHASVCARCTTTAATVVATACATFTVAPHPEDINK